MTALNSDRMSKRYHRLARKSGLRAGWNSARFGRHAPRPHQMLLIDPNRISLRYAPGKNAHLELTARYSGHVSGGDWDRCTTRLASALKIKACRMHFIDGVPWEDTGIYDHLLGRIQNGEHVDNLRSFSDIKTRYQRLDALWTRARRDKRLAEDAVATPRVSDGILVHIGRTGMIVFGNQGFHRLAIAQLAGIAHIPVVIGRVHRSAVVSGAYAAVVRQYGLSR